MSRSKSEELLNTLNELNAATKSLADLQQEFNTLETKIQDLEKSHSKSVESLKQQHAGDKATSDKKTAHLTKMYTQLLDEKKSWTANAANSNDESKLALQQ